MTGHLRLPIQLPARGLARFHNTEYSSNKFPSIRFLTAPKTGSGIKLFISDPMERSKKLLPCLFKQSAHFLKVGFLELEEVDVTYPVSAVQTARSLCPGWSPAARSCRRLARRKPIGHTALHTCAHTNLLETHNTTGNAYKYKGRLASKYPTSSSVAVCVCVCVFGVCVCVCMCVFTQGGARRRHDTAHYVIIIVPR